MSFQESCGPVTRIFNSRRGGAIEQTSLEVDHREASSFRSRLVRSFHAMFLPEGYPQSVSPDYIHYQVWDTFQALCSSVTGTLSTRSILQGVGVGAAEASLVSGTLSWIVRDGVGMVSRIAFASCVASDLDYDAKKWRLVADLTNDTALMIEVFSTYLPASWFIVAVCIASFFKAVTGVAGGSARASLTQHFAVRQNTADVAAKDGSQETAANLIGMLLGMLVTVLVPADSFVATAAVFFSCTAMHLYCNYNAVRSLTIIHFNRQRLDSCLDKALRTEQLPSMAKRHQQAAGNATPRAGSTGGCLVPTPTEVSREECILLPHKTILGIEKASIHHGSSLGSIAKSLAGNPTRQLSLTRQVMRLVETNEASALVYNRKTDDYHVIVSDAATPLNILKKHVLAVYHYHQAEESGVASSEWEVVAPTEKKFEAFFSAFCASAVSSGWRLDRVQLRSSGWTVQSD